MDTEGKGSREDEQKERKRESQKTEERERERKRERERARVAGKGKKQTKRNETKRNERKKERAKEKSAGICGALSLHSYVLRARTRGALYYTITVTKKPSIQRHPSDEDETKEYRMVAIFTYTFSYVCTLANEVDVLCVA